MASPLSSLPADAPQRAWRESREERRRARDDKRWREQRQTQEIASLAHHSAASAHSATSGSEESEELPAHMSGVPALSQMQSFTNWQASSAPVASGSSNIQMAASSSSAASANCGGRSLSLKRRFEQTSISTPPTAAPPMTSNAQAHPFLFAVPVASTVGASNGGSMDVETLLASGTSLALSPSAAVVAASLVAALPADASGDSKRRKLDRLRMLGS